MAFWVGMAFIVWRFGKLLGLDWDVDSFESWFGIYLDIDTDTCKMTRETVSLSTGFKRRESTTRTE